MKQNKQSICLAAPPLRQCVYFITPKLNSNTCCFSCCPLARSERMGQTVALPVTGEKWSYCNPVSIPVNRRPVLS